MEYIIWLVVASLAALIAAKVAKGKGRRPVRWAVFGFLFPLIAVIAVLVVDHNYQGFPSSRADAVRRQEEPRPAADRWRQGTDR